MSLLSITFVPSKQNAIADALLRLPLPSAFNKEYAIYRVEERLVHSLPITHKEISYTTRVDPALSRASEFVKQGWPQHVEDLRLQPLFTCRFQLSVEQDCLPWGLRVIIPTQLSCLQISVVINAIHWNNSFWDNFEYKPVMAYLQVS